MAALNLPETDPTLAAIDAALEAAQHAEPVRGYLGMSSVGHECERKLWYSFRKVAQPKHKADTLKRFACGHAGEALQAERLRMVEGVELITHGEDGKQIGFEDHGGHFRGHMDGAIHGLLQAPKTWHVWEHKQVGESVFAAFQKTKRENDEKLVLRLWNPVYYTQAQLYMAYSGMKRHYLTVSTPGGRQTDSCRTEYDADFAKKAKEKAERIILATEPPPRMKDDPTWYECRWCDYNAQCHGNAIAAKNCKTCVHSTPVENAEWSCGRWNSVVPSDALDAGCGDHLYIPPLIPYAEPTDSTEHVIVYRHKTNGRMFANVGESADIGEGMRDGIDSVYQSSELAVMVSGLVADPVLDDLRQRFDAKCVSSTELSNDDEPPREIDEHTQPLF